MTFAQTGSSMSNSARSLSAFRNVSLLAGLLACVQLAACSGGGTAGSSLELVSVSVSGNSSWQLNRPILFQFSTDVEPTSVNMNTIHIGQTAGGVALGEFSMADSRTVKFQPRCPTLPDNSDAGLIPGGVSYTIQIPGAGAGGATVRSTGGSSLADSQTLRFSTVDSDDPALLFIDTGSGPPNPVVRDPHQAGDTRIEIGDDPSNVAYFLPRTPPDSELGADMPVGFTGGLNLYSDVATHVSILVAIDQAVESSSDNVSTDTVRLEYQSGSGAWISLAHTVVLEANCTGTGALLRVTPTGILPQNHLVRVVLTRDFKDIVGDSNLVSVTVGSFLVSTATDPGTSTPGAAADQILEQFSTDTLEDTTTVLPAPRADWASQGLLKAGFAFGGTGGPPDGDFDWKIGNDLPASPTNRPVVPLDTSFSVIINQQQDFTQTVVNGVVDIRNLLITESGILKITGPNPCKILVAGSATINGVIDIRGTDDLSVASLDSANLPEPGAAGNAGGGSGGTASQLTSQSDPAGGNGFGAFANPDGGGIGGESGFNHLWPADGDDAHRRPAGGGGGTLGHNAFRPIGIVAGYANLNSCPDQAVVGFDAEQGFSGSPVATGVLSGASPPIGGMPGPRPFFDSDPENDFWGTMKNNTTGQLIPGELSRPWAGAGGGAGGDAINSNSFPDNPFTPAGDEKGCGGGGGAGSLTILALGNITFGPHGRIDASGGTGGGGENSASGDITHIGGGSGGGSGGHIVLQTGSQINLSACVSTVSGVLDAGGLYALGGEGGAGKNNVGGSMPGGMPVGPASDALPPNSYPHATAPCGVTSGVVTQGGYTFTNQVGESSGDAPLVVICAGGDGGPGLIQLHAPQLTDILVPAPPSTEKVYSVIKPPPVGSVPGAGLPSYAAINNPLVWNQLLPVFGRRSAAISKWISLGAASVSADASSTTPDPVQFIFKGTDAAGVVSTTGSGSAATVAELTPVLTGTIAADPVTPFIDTTDQRTVVFDATTLIDADDIYLRNMELFKRFLLRMTHGTSTDFEVAAASYDPATHLLRLTVSGSGTPLSPFGVGATVEVRPRFFRVLTDNVANSLPDSSQILIEFQATQANAQGDPDEGAAVVSAWVPNPATIDPNVPPNPNYKFFRFRVSFDISANGAPLSFDTPIPSLDFFRIPFRF